MMRLAQQPLPEEAETHADAIFIGPGEQTFPRFLEDLRRVEDENLRHMARIIRGADTARLDLEAQCGGLLALSLGISALHGDDLAALDHGILLYDGLYAWARNARVETRN
jgi:hypothetical protein